MSKQAKKYYNKWLNNRNDKRESHQMIEDYFQEQLKEIMPSDEEQLSLDILTLVASEEYKGKEFIYDQHQMIIKLLKKNENSTK